MICCLVSCCLLWATFGLGQEPGGPPDELVWHDGFADTQAWTAQPSWLSNPSPTAALTRSDGAACFRVDEPHRGQKWSRSLPPIALDETPWLVMRYRAEALNRQQTDYVVYLRDGDSTRQLSPVTPRDLTVDGQWHVLAVDVSRLTTRSAVDQLAIQVQAGVAGRARLWLAWIGFSDAAPAGATVIAKSPADAAPADWSAPLAQAQWTANPSWLANPAAADQHGVTAAGGLWRFRVLLPTRGMKWSWSLPAPVEPARFRYAVMRYRSRGLSSSGHYALCLLGKNPAGASDYQVAIGPAELIGDGRQHIAWVSLRQLAEKLPEITGFACEVQAVQADAELEIADIRLAHAPPTQPLSDMCLWREGTQFEAFAPVPLPAAGTADPGRWLQRLRLTGWPTAEHVTVEGIPFALPASRPRWVATTLREKSALRVPVGVQTSEVFLFLLAWLSGAEEPVYGESRLRAICDVDRFRLRLEYTDGTADECLPLNVVTRRFGVVAGAQVLVAAADERKTLREIVVCDRTRQGAFAVAAATVRVGGPRGFPETLEESSPWGGSPKRPKESWPWGGSLNRQHPAWGASSTRPRPTENLPSARAWCAPDVRLDRSPRLQQWCGNPFTDWGLLAAPSPLLTVTVDGKEIPPADFRPAGPASSSADTARYGFAGVDGLTVTLTAESEPEGLAVRATVENTGPKPRRVSLVVPRVGPYRLSADAAAAYYLVPKCGAALDNRPCAYRERYCGLFPLQFLDTFSPADGHGLFLRTEDRDCVWKYFRLEKAGAEFTLGVEYPERTLKPGEWFTTPRGVLQLTDGGWWHGLEAYRDWVHSWYWATAPRQPWFREVFNFRQRFLYGLDPLDDGRRIDLQRAVDEATREFGGVDYLHLFDWGNCGPYGRIYGRVSDHSPFDYLRGGQAALQAEIARVQAQGVPVGLYIEGYLLDERGRLGVRSGKSWQMLDAAGHGRRWPNSTELYVCPFVEPWRDVQAATYAEKARQLNVSGMYIDEFGFAGSHVDCWSADHGHDRPGYAVVGERGATQRIRRSVNEAKRGVVLYTEESPVDVVTQWQDGSFTYAMATARRTVTRVPLNLTRFALPSFKTIEILYCDKPTGSWATGVQWVFFNGEAIWLEGPAAEWFEPETRETIRQCYRILRTHRDAFTTDNPQPLVPTLVGGVFANAFPAAGKTVYTLYNTRHRTVRGELLAVPAAAGQQFEDAWHGGAARVRREGDQALVTLELGPHGAGCLVVRQ
jgi:hypothetical protein